jgi:hypothetical protein
MVGYGIEATCCIVAVFESHLGVERDDDASKPRQRR